MKKMYGIMVDGVSWQDDDGYIVAFDTVRELVDYCLKDDIITKYTSIEGEENADEFITVSECYGENWEEVVKEWSFKKLKYEVDTVEFYEVLCQ